MSKKEMIEKKISELEKQLKLGIREVCLYKCRVGLRDEVIEVLKEQDTPFAIIEKTHQAFQIQVFLFSNQEVKEKYAEEIRIIKEDNISLKEKRSILGLMLGHPPEGVKVFSEMDEHVELRYVTTIDYCGMKIITSREAVVADLIWIHENRPVAEKDYYLQISTGIKKGQFEELSVSTTITTNKHLPIEDIIESVKKHIL